MPWAIRLRGDKTTEVCSSYGMHRGAIVVGAGLEPAFSQGDQALLLTENLRCFLTCTLSFHNSYPTSIVIAPRGHC
jgi:hypothetical protein